MIRAWICGVMAVVCACAARAPGERLDLQAAGADVLWIPAVRNRTDADLRLPATNPLRSLAEMAGKVPPEARESVMTLLRRSLRQELRQREVRARFPEEQDARFAVLPLGYEAAARIAREGGLEGMLLLSEIRRWDADAVGALRLWLEFRLVRIADGVLIWERRVQKPIAASRTGNPAHVHQDAVKEVVGELF